MLWLLRWPFFVELVYVSFKCHFNSIIFRDSVFPRKKVIISLCRWRSTKIKDTIVLNFPLVVIFACYVENRFWLKPKLEGDTVIAF